MLRNLFSCLWFVKEAKYVLVYNLVNLFNVRNIVSNDDKYCYCYASVHVILKL